MVAIARALPTRRIGRWSWSLLLWALLVLLVVGPLVGLLHRSFEPDSGTGGLTLDHYRNLFTASMRTAVANTIVVSLGATIGSVALGGFLAWLAARTDVPARGLVQMAGIAPLFFSSLVGALTWSALASPASGYLNLLFRDIGVPFTLSVYNAPGIVFVLTLYSAPFAFLFINAALNLASADLEGAARVAGATSWRETTRITFPLVMPSIVGAAILIFVIVSENFPVVEILGSYARMDFLPTQMFRLVNQFPARVGDAAALGIVVLVVLWLVVWFQRAVVLRRSYVTVGGKGDRPKRIELGRWRWPALGVAVLSLLLSTVLPLCALVIGAFRRNQFAADFGALVDPSEYTGEKFTAAMQYQPFRDGMRNSLVMALLAALAGVVVAFVLAYAARRRNAVGSGAIDFIALTPVALPALVLGVAYLSFWLDLPVSLYGTMTILVLAYTARFVPQGFEALSGTLLKVDDELEDGAVVAGAGRPRAAISITVPVLRSAFFSTGILLFVLSFRELTTALFLYTPKTQVVAIVIYGQWVEGNWPRLASMSLAFTGVLMVLGFFARKGLGRSTGGART